MSKKKVYTEIFEIDINEDLKIGLKKPNFRFLMKYQKDIVELPNLLKDQKNIEENLDKAFGLIERVLMKTMVDPVTMEPILSNTPNENQCRFEDFSPSANWELLDAQGVKNLMSGDIGFGLFGFLMEKIGALHFGGTEKEVKSFPKKRDGDKVSDAGETLPEKTE